MLNKLMAVISLVNQIIINASFTFLFIISLTPDHSFLEFFLKLSN